MARKTSHAKARTELLRKTRFIVYQTAQGYWIARIQDGRVTVAFPVPLDDGGRGAIPHSTRRP